MAKSKGIHWSTSSFNPHLVKKPEEGVRNSLYSTRCVLFDHLFKSVFKVDSLKRMLKRFSCKVSKLAWKLSSLNLGIEMTAQVRRISATDRTCQSSSRSACPRILLVSPPIEAQRIRTTTRMVKDNRRPYLTLRIWWVHLPIPSAACGGSQICCAFCAGTTCQYWLTHAFAQRQNRRRTCLEQSQTCAYQSVSTNPKRTGSPPDIAKQSRLGALTKSVGFLGKASGEKPSAWSLTILRAFWNASSKDLPNPITSPTDFIELPIWTNR